MFADNTLTPKEAVRLCALGTVARHPMHYGELAGAVRHFISRVAGPQLDLMGMSVELLRYEGLVEESVPTGATADADNPLLTLTPSGRRELLALLTARIRPGTDLTKLVIALKMRFLHLLDAADRRAQADLLMDGVEAELARMADLRATYADDEEQAGSHLVQWLDHDIAQLEKRLTWLEEFSARL